MPAFENAGENPAVMREESAPIPDVAKTPEVNLFIDQQEFKTSETSANRLKELDFAALVQESPQDLTPEQLTDLGTVLKTFQKANDTFFYMDARPNQYVGTFAYDKWDELASDLQENVGELLGFDFRSAFRTETDIDKGLAGTRNLMEIPEFQDKAALAEVLMQGGWYAKQACFRTFANVAESQHPETRVHYESMKNAYNEVLALAVPSLVEEGNLLEVGKIFDHLAFSDLPVGTLAPGEFSQSGRELAAEILVDEAYNLDARKDVLREYVKVFGPIHAVDAISHKFAQMTQDGRSAEDPYVADLVQVYGWLQGENVPNPMEKLEDVYEVSGYAQNERAELTKVEAAHVAHLAELYVSGISYSRVHAGSQKGEIKVLHDAPPEDPQGVVREPTSVKILELGAGNARVSRELWSQGFTHCVAVDFDPTNTAVAKERAPDPNFPVLRADWHHLPFQDAEPNYSASPEINARKRAGEFEVLYTTERSFLHNRTPVEWLSLFDETRRVSSDRAFLGLDIPDTETGVYAERIKSYAQNMKENLGLDPAEMNIIFDGPGQVKFNRLAISDEQLRIYARLFGYAVVEKTADAREDMTDVYYTLAKDQNFVFGDISESELNESLEKLGIFSYQTDYNMHIKAWGMTLGQAIKYGPDYAASLHSSPYVQAEFAAGRGPLLWADNKGGVPKLREEVPFV